MTGPQKAHRRRRPRPVSTAALVAATLTVELCWTTAPTTTTTTTVRASPTAATTAASSPSWASSSASPSTDRRRSLLTPRRRPIWPTRVSNHDDDGVAPPRTDDDDRLRQTRRNDAHTLGGWDGDEDRRRQAVDDDIPPGLRDHYRRGHRRPVRLDDDDDEDDPGGGGSGGWGWGGHRGDDGESIVRWKSSHKNDHERSFVASSSYARRDDHDGYPKECRRRHPKPQGRSDHRSPVGADLEEEHASSAFDAIDRRRHDDDINLGGAGLGAVTGSGTGVEGLLRIPCSIVVAADENDPSPRPRLLRQRSIENHAGDGKNLAGDGTPIAAYVDTGAQLTVISSSAAKRSSILHLVDRRYAGEASGVGHGRILGRIHAGQIRFVLGGGEGEETVEMDGPALTVLEEGTLGGTEQHGQGIDVLLGLDVLREWDAEVSLKSSSSSGAGAGAGGSLTVRKRSRRRRGGGGGGGEEDVVVRLPFVTSDGRSRAAGGRCSGEITRPHEEEEEADSFLGREKRRHHQRRRATSPSVAFVPRAAAKTTPPPTRMDGSPVKLRHRTDAAAAEVDRNRDLHLERLQEDTTKDDVERDLDFLDSSSSSVGGGSAISSHSSSALVVDRGGDDQRAVDDDVSRVETVYCDSEEQEDDDDDDSFEEDEGNGRFNMSGM